jgi:alpha-L-rhamnosidase
MPEAAGPTVLGAVAVQTHYRVGASSSLDKLHAGDFDLWDSGFIRSEACSAIEFLGDIPKPGQDAWWVVRLIDADGGDSGWSDPAMWSERLEGWPCKWIGNDAARGDDGEVSFDGASWIWHPDEPAKNAKAGTCDFRVTFESTGSAVDLLVSGDDHYTVEIDGNSVLADPGGADAWKKPQEASVPLKAGRHAAVFTVKNGADGPAGLIAKITEGDRQIVSGPDWEAKRPGSDEWTKANKVADYGDAPWGKIKSGLVLPPPRLLRREIYLRGPVKRARLTASAFGIYTVSIDGQEVSDEFFAPGWTDYTKRLHFRTYDVTEQVDGDSCCLSAILADGWYSGYVGFGNHRDHYGTELRFGCVLDIEYEDGSSQQVITDEDWRTSTGGLQYADFLMGEKFDTSFEPAGWKEAGFDAADWSQVDIGAEFETSMEPYPMAPCRLAKPVLKAKAIGKNILDFGQNTAGVAIVSASGPKGASVKLRHAEVLAEDGSLYTTNLRSAVAEDTLVLDGAATFAPRFTFHGFRYIEPVGEAKISDIEVHAVSNLSRLTGQFSCSDERLNQLWSNIVWTQLMNFIEVPTDCPQRDERLGWTGDAQVFAGTATYAADVQTFFRKWLVDMVDAQREDGQYPMVAPVKVAGNDGGPGWADAGIIVPWAMYQAYGDHKVLEQQYDSMEKFMGFLRGRSEEAGAAPEKFHCFGDWVSVEGDIPHDVIYTAFYGHCADLMSKISGVLGKEDKAASYAELYSSIRSVFQREYVEADGTIKGDRQCSYVLALSFGMLDDPLKSKAEARFADEVEKKGHLTTGFLGTRDLPRVLRDIGRTDLAYKLLMRDEYPGWLFPVKHGATSIWERWNGWTPENGYADPGMNSFAHYAFGAVGQFMWETVIGLSPLEPGYKRFLVAPEPGPLEHAEGVFDSIAGQIRVAWKATGAGVGLDVTVPPSTEAVIRLPGRPEVVAGPGRHSFDSRVT